MTVRILIGDARARLKDLADESVHCCVCSPPYFGLRAYLPDGHPDKARELGGEPTPQAYVDELVAVFREVKRVLRSDGTVWLNLGDSYGRGDRVDNVNDHKRGTGAHAAITAAQAYGLGPRGHIRNKDLIGIPWLVAFALRQPFHTGPIKRVEDRAWLAAMLDSDGCLGVRIQHPRPGRGTNETFIPYLSISQTDTAALEHCVRITGMGRVAIKSQPGQDSRGIQSTRTFYTWRLDGQLASAVIRDVYPYLLIKKRQAQVVYAMNISLKWGRPSRALPVPPEVMTRRRALYEAGKLLNQRSEITLSDLPEIPPADEPGWWLRSDIIWQKPNPMPESCTDRPTSAHEHVFLLAKSATYFYDADAVKEPSEMKPQRRLTAQLSADGGHAVDAWKEPRILRTEPGADGDGTRNLRNVWTIASQPFPEAHFACVDEATECLTSKGWLPQDSMRPGLLAAQFDLATHQASWGEVKDVARYDVHDQEMVAARTRDLDMLLTPNHRCIIHRRHPRTRLYKDAVIVRADALLPSHAVPTSAVWSGTGDTSLPIEWAELLGWYIAEGRESAKTAAVEIYQSDTANPQHVRRIEQLLQQVGAEWTSARYERTWRGRPTSSVAFRVVGFAAHRLRELAPSKAIPAGALLWADDRVQALLQGLVGGDGHTRDDGRSMFVQKDFARASAVHALAFRVGLSATLSKRPDGIHTVYLSKHRFRSFRGTAGVGVPTDRERYTGIVWCPRTPLGTWVARRNGRIFITGNTFPPALVEPCIKAGTSEKGCCPHCGAGWEREVIMTPSTEGRNNWAGQSASKSAASRSRKGGFYDATSKTMGWSPSCRCPDHAPVPCTVLDPFGGAGTTGMVADRLGRNAILIELSPAYSAMAEDRLHDDAGLFASVQAERMVAAE